jgi:hypothetical protein
MFFNHIGYDENDVKGAHALGWASIGIGLAEVALTKQVQNLLGLDDRPQRRGILRTLGVRELMHGASILVQNKPDIGMRAGVWSRVAGDALDTALLAKASTRTKKPILFGIVSAMVMCIGVADFLCASKLSNKYGDT